MTKIVKNFCIDSTEEELYQEFKSIVTMQGITISSKLRDFIRAYVINYKKQALKRAG